MKISPVCGVAVVKMMDVKYLVLRACFTRTKLKKKIKIKGEFDAASVDLLA